MFMHVSDDHKFFSQNDQQWESPEIKKRQKIDQKFPFWSCQNRFVTSQELPICTTCTCVVQNGKSWLFKTEIQTTPLTSRSFPQKMGCEPVLISPTPNNAVKDKT
jgi:hypothetical protein